MWHHSIAGSETVTFVTNGIEESWDSSVALTVEEEPWSSLHGDDDAGS